MPPLWRAYQDEAAEFFRSLGLDATTDVTLQGVRTQHDVDVLVCLEVAGFEVRWVIECKHWKTPVNKLHVLGLRQIVSDLGADRGILLCEAGCQSGAIEAAELTNIQVTSLAELEVSSRGAVYAVRLRDLYDRVEAARTRYWDIPKRTRIDHDLRPESGAPGYSSTQVMGLSLDLITRALRGVYPIVVDPFTALGHPEFPAQFANHEELVIALEPALAELERKLATVPNSATTQYSTGTGRHGC